MKLYADEKAHPVALFFALSKAYGHAWLDWLPHTLKETVAQDTGVRLTTLNTGKALAAAALATNNSFWTQWDVFHFLTQALNGQPPTAHELQEHSVGQMMAAADDAAYLRAHLEKVIPVPAFTETVARYVAAQALGQNIWWLPAPLGFASPYASGKSYRCHDCDNEAEVLYTDGLCDSCVDRFDTSSLRPWTPDPALAGRGKNIEYFEQRPSKDVAARFEQLAKDPSLPLAETQTDVCAGRLAYAHQYMLARRVLRDRQLEAS